MNKRDPAARQCGTYRSPDARKKAVLYCMVKNDLMFKLKLRRRRDMEGESLMIVMNIVSDVDRPSQFDATVQYSKGLRQPESPCQSRWKTSGTSIRNMGSAGGHEA